MAAHESNLPHPNLIVSVPETIQVKLVEAGQLRDYESWSVISSILSSAVRRQLERPFSDN